MTTVRSATEQTRNTIAGQTVEVWCAYTGSWSGRFIIEESTADGLKLRRFSDFTVLPGTFGIDRVRPI